MNKPLLSICIPTYNRATCLKECLESIVSQFNDEGVLNQVEVVISDNASTDNTVEIVKEFQKNFSNIYYSKNETNLGFDRNLLKVVERSVGEYCLTLGDDDGFLPNTLSILINKIQTLRAPYFMLNTWGYDHDLIHPVVPHPNRKIKEDIIYDSLMDFVKSIDNYVDLVGNFGGMSAQLFKRSFWVDFDKKEKYLDTQIIHIHILLTVFKNSMFILLSEPIIKTRNDNMRYDDVPGFETNSQRCNVSIKTTLWISDLYNLSLSPRKVQIYFRRRSYIISLKNFIKKILFMIRLRKSIVDTK